jgi:hypothetical protein
VLEKGAKAVQSGLFQKFDFERKSLVFQVFPLEAQRLTVILSPVRLPFRHSGIDNQ